MSRARVLTGFASPGHQNHTDNKKNIGQCFMKAGFQTSGGGFDFLVMRRRQGAVEIVYDDGVARRMVWRVCAPANEGHISEALTRAAREVRVLPALFAELRKRAIAIEMVAI